MNAPEWMNWGGWTWVAIAIAYCQGWFLRGHYEKQKRRRERLKGEMQAREFD